MDVLGCVGLPCLWGESFVSAGDFLESSILRIESRSLVIPLLDCVGILSKVNILERIDVWIPSMKYLIKALLSLILDHPVRIQNWEIYSLAVPFPCLSCCN